MTRSEAIKAGLERINTEDLTEEEINHITKVIYDNAWTWDEFAKELTKK